MVYSKKQLAIILSKLKVNKSPNPRLEQYDIPGELAAEIVNLASVSEDIEDKLVLDLGCGSGRLMIGSLIVGAEKVIGVDIDKRVIKTAKENVKLAEKITGKKLLKKTQLIHSNIEDWKGQVDTVIQNPPFGIQKKHADRVFLEKALESGKNIYSLHRSYYKSRKFLTNYVQNHGGKVEKIIKHQFRMPHTFEFHEKPAVIFDVDLYVIRNI